MGCLWWMGIRNLSTGYSEVGFTLTSDTWDSYLFSRFLTKGIVNCSEVVNWIDLCRGKVGRGLLIPPSCCCQPVSLKSLEWLHKGLDYVRHFYILWLLYSSEYASSAHRRDINVNQARLDIKLLSTNPWHCFLTGITWGFVQISI